MDCKTLPFSLNCAKVVVAVLLPALLICVLPVLSQVCPAPPSNDPYPLVQIHRCPLVLVCLERHCTCVGGTLIAASGSCIAASTTCGMAMVCHRRLYACLEDVAIASSNVSNNDQCESWGFTARNALLQYAARPGNYSLTTTFRSCSSRLCNSLNGTTGCIPNPLFACGFVLSATNSSGSNAAADTIYGTFSIPGDFSVFVNPTDVASLRSAVSKDLADAVPGSVITSVMIQPLATFSRSSAYDAVLVVQFQVTIASNDTASVANAKSALSALTTTSAWLVATRSALVNVFPTGQIALPVLDYSTAPPVVSPSPVDAVCSSKCIAAIAVGVVVIVLIAILVYCFLKSEKKGSSQSSKSVDG